MTHTDTTPLFQIWFLEWHQFLDEWINCMEPTQQIREVFETCDCFRGGHGPNPQLYVSISTLFSLSPPFIVFWRNERYGVKVEDTDWYFNHMALLENMVTSWPPRVQMKKFSDKVNLTKQLDQISEVMNTGRPKTTKLQRGQLLPEGMVLKRTHSDCGIHVFIPSEVGTVTWDRLEEGPPSSSWISQEYTIHLRNLGEWRAIIVDGKLLYVVHTVCNPSKGLWKWSKVDRYYSLEEIRCVLITVSRETPFKPQFWQRNA